MSEMSQEMSEPAPPTETQPSPQRGTSGSARTPQFRILALAVIVVVGGIVLWLALRDNGGSKPQALHASAVSESQLSNLAKTVGHPVFWVGHKPGFTYELSRTSNGSIYVRYLPAGVAVGASKPYLTVGTYPFAAAYGALQTVAKQNGETPIKVAHGGLAVVSSSYPESVHVAYPGVDYQVEVYDPSPGVAAALVAAGKVAAFGSLAPPAKAQAISAAGLTALAKSLKHPLYWLGPKAGDTYEMTQTSNGNVYVRYLPPGVKVGAPHGYLLIGTYPYTGAYAALQGLAKQPGIQQIKLKDGGLAVYDPKSATNIHIAYPGSDLEIEVFSPSAAQAKSLVSSGQVRATG
jgi:hypothetical protein